MLLVKAQVFPVLLSPTALVQIHFELLDSKSTVTKTSNQSESSGT